MDSSLELTTNHTSTQIMEPTQLLLLEQRCQVTSMGCIITIILVISAHPTLREKKITLTLRLNSDSHSLDNGRQTGTKATTCHLSTIYTKTCLTNNFTPLRSHSCMPMTTLSLKTINSRLSFQRVQQTFR